MTKDPVCGMNISEQTASQQAQHEGKTYYFCSSDCKQEFEENPEQYARQTA
jgi:Cu+-exporting ATPase